MASPDNNNLQQDGGNRKKRRKRRWGDAADQPSTVPAAPPAAAPALDAKAKALALQESVRAKLAALKASKAATATGTKRPLPPTAAAPETSTEPKAAKRAKHFDLDFSVTAPSFQKESQPTSIGGVNKKKVNPYLSYSTVAQDDDDDDDNYAVDDRLVRVSKPRSRHKPISFVEPGTFIERAERKRQKALNAQQAGYASGRKVGHAGPSQGLMAQVYGAAGEGVNDDWFSKPTLLPERAETRYDQTPLVMEWWDLELLPSKAKKKVVAVEGTALSKQTQAQLLQLGKGSSASIKKEEEGDKMDEKPKATATSHDEESKSTEQNQPEQESNKEVDVIDLRQTCFEQASLRYCKTADLVQHPVPYQPPHVQEARAAAAKKKPVLYLTKKELKRQRKLRRQEKQRELQDRQAAGLEAPPEPRLTLQNFMRVLGDQAVLDPSQMEQKVMEQMQARQRAHLERNEAMKLTKEQRAEKRTRKLQEDTTMGVRVAIFYVTDMSHPYHRAKVELNAQQNFITGGVLECRAADMACVICEGGPKAIRRYKRLMLVRMKWTGGDDDEEEEEEEEVDEANADLDGEEGAVKTHKFNKENRCELVWEGLAVKRLFQGFVFQNCESAAQARKVLKAKGVEHYWDQVMQHAHGKKQGFQLKLVDDDTDNNYDQAEDDEEEEDAMDES